jgi:dihydroorotate dehydrogenase (NAD+) catalytic subunit
MFKNDLTFRSPLMNAAGILGFTPDPKAPLPWDSFGAFVTNPISLRPRRPVTEPAMFEYPGGFLLHTGLPNPGFASVTQKYAPRWRSATLPIIVHLMADRPEETTQMVQRLENIENIAAVELGFAPGLSDDILFFALEMSLGELPLIMSLSGEQAIRLGARLQELGAAAVSLAAPRGTLSLQGKLVSGRLQGPGLFPQTLETVRRLSGAGIPVIGAGGVYQREQAQALVEAGALGVQVDSVLWKSSAF